MANIKYRNSANEQWKVLSSPKTNLIVRENSLVQTTDSVNTASSLHVGDIATTEEILGTKNLSGKIASAQTLRDVAPKFSFGQETTIGSLAVNASMTIPKSGFLTAYLNPSTSSAVTYFRMSVNGIDRLGQVLPAQGFGSFVGTFVNSGDVIKVTYLSNASNVRFTLLPIEVTNGVVSSASQSFGMRYTKLWENPNPSSIFYAQTIACDLMSYSHCAIEYRIHSGNDLYTFSTPTRVTKKGRLALITDSSTTNLNTAYRQFTANTTGVVFEGVISGNGSQTSSDYCIPIAIYGVNL